MQTTEATTAPEVTLTPLRHSAEIEQARLRLAPLAFAAGATTFHLSEYGYTPFEGIAIMSVSFVAYNGEITVQNMVALGSGITLAEAESSFLADLAARKAPRTEG